MGGGVIVGLVIGFFLGMAWQQLVSTRERLRGVLATIPGLRAAIREHGRKALFWGVVALLVAWAAFRSG